MAVSESATSPEPCVGTRVTRAVSSASSAGNRPILRKGTWTGVALPGSGLWQLDGGAPPFREEPRALRLRALRERFSQGPQLEERHGGIGGRDNDENHIGPAMPLARPPLSGDDVAQHRDHEQEPESSGRCPPCELAVLGLAAAVGGVTAWIAVHAFSLAGTPPSSRPSSLRRRNWARRVYHPPHGR
jgi:hypothetical protein